MNSIRFQQRILSIFDSRMNWKYMQNYEIKAQIKWQFNDYKQMVRLTMCDRENDKVVAFILWV